MTDIRFVTIATYGTSGEAHLAKNMLAEHEIPALLDGAALLEHWSPRVGGLTGGIKLQVSEAEAAREPVIGRSARAAIAIAIQR